MSIKNGDHLEFVWNGKKVVALVLEWMADKVVGNLPTEMSGCAILHSPMLGGTNIEAIKRDWLEKNAKKSSLSLKEINELWNPYFKKSLYLTVGQLKKQLANYPDDWRVYIERIEDVYFEKHGWTTEKFVWQEDFEETEGIRATGVGLKNGKVIITAHY